MSFADAGARKASTKDKPLHASLAEPRKRLWKLFYVAARRHTGFRITAAERDSCDACHVDVPSNEILKFEKKCKALLRDGGDPSLSIQAWLNKNNFSERLAREYCEPMVGAIWSRTQGDVLEEFPILGVAQFLENHYMLDRSRPAWRTPAWRCTRRGTALRTSRPWAGSRVPRAA